MVDIHCHILPGIDDGPTSMRESIAMARAAVQAGTSTVVATPHSSPDMASIRKSDIIPAVEDFAAMLEDSGISLQVLPGSEIYLDLGVRKLVVNGSIPTLADEGKYVLVEFPISSMPDYLTGEVFSMAASGIVPIIAHPERYWEVWKDPNKVIPLMRSGALMQLSAGSFLGYYGPEATSVARIMLEHNMCHFIASDAHSPAAYEAMMKPSYNLISNNYGKALADRMFIHNPGAVIRGESLTVPEPMEFDFRSNPRRKRGLFSR